MLESQKCQRDSLTASPCPLPSGHYLVYSSEESHPHRRPGSVRRSLESSWNHLYDQLPWYSLFITEVTHFFRYWYCSWHTLISLHLLEWGYGGTRQTSSIWKGLLKSWFGAKSMETNLLKVIIQKGMSQGKWIQWATTSPECLMHSFPFGKFYLAYLCTKWFSNINLKHIHLWGIILNAWMGLIWNSSIRIYNSQKGSDFFIWVFSQQLENLDIIWIRVWKNFFFRITPNLHLELK